LLKVALKTIDKPMTGTDGMKQIYSLPFKYLLSLLLL